MRSKGSQLKCSLPNELAVEQNDHRHGDPVPTPTQQLDLPSHRVAWRQAKLPEQLVRMKLRSGDVGLILRQPRAAEG